MGTNLRPFLETLISSLPSTPLSHQSCRPCFHLEWVSFVRTDPFRHAMVVVFPESVAPLQTLQLFSVFHRLWNSKRSLRLPLRTITTVFSLWCRRDKYYELTPQFNLVRTRRKKYFFNTFLGVFWWTLFRNKKEDSGNWNATHESLAAMLIFDFSFLLNTCALAPFVPMLRAPKNCREPH